MIKVKDKDFNLEIEYKNIKNIYMRFIYPNTIKITCSRLVKKDTIIKFIRSKEDWVYKVYSKKIEVNSNTKLSIGDMIYYRGKKYMLECHRGKDDIRINDNILIIYSKKDDMQDILKVFYEKAKIELMNDVKGYQDKYLNILKDYGYILEPIYKFRMMKSRWGVCYTKKNMITLNLLLIHYESKYLEAVLWHELLHFVIPNHSKRFHEILEYHMADYKERMKGLI